MMDQQNFEAARPVSADPAVALAKALGQLPKAAPAARPAMQAVTPPGGSGPAPQPAAGATWMRAEHPDAPGFYMWVLDRRAPEGLFECADGRWVHFWTIRPTLVLEAAEADVLPIAGPKDDMRAGSGVRIGMNADDLVVLYHYYPLLAEAFRKFPSADWVAFGAARNLGTSERALTWEVMLPAALPQIFTGLQVALPIALIVGILTEMAMGGYGIGASMQTASRFADSLGVFAGIIEIAVVGYALVKLMAVLRARLLVWHPEALEPTTV